MLLFARAMPPRVCHRPQKACMNCPLCTRCNLMFEWECARSAYSTLGPVKESSAREARAKILVYIKWAGRGPGTGLLHGPPRGPKYRFCDPSWPLRKSDPFGIYIGRLQNRFEVRLGPLLGALGGPKNMNMDHLGGPHSGHLG